MATAAISEKRRSEMRASPSRLAWRSFLRNRTAVVGMLACVLFSNVAVLGLLLTSGDHPVFDPRHDL